MKHRAHISPVTTDSNFVGLHRAAIATTEVLRRDLFLEDELKAAYVSSSVKTFNESIGGVR